MIPPSQPSTVLVVDDIPANRNVLGETLEKEGFEVLLAPDGETAIKVALKATPDVILLDVMMPGIDGFETCRRLKANPATHPIPVIFISAQNETRAMVGGFKAGGVDYIAKPFQAEEVLIRVRTHLVNYRLTREILETNRELEAMNGRLREEIDRRVQAESSLELADAKLSLITEQEAERWGLPAFVGRSEAMRRLLDDIRRLQPVDNTPVLIRGESGTGKELVARALHFSGRRKRQPFIAVNCAAVPADLAESLFFGHMKGAFSGAHENRKGYFELAHGGTLFLDEIGDMPLNLQAKLLRALENGSFTPVGGTNERRADVRVVAATNVDLQERIGSGAFRRDLYFRIRGYDIQLKPLRERREDVELFIAHFLKGCAAELKIAAPNLSPDAHAALMAYDFPGNIRELKSILERALIESGGRSITEAHLHLLNENVFVPALSRTGSLQDSIETSPLNLEQAQIEWVKRALTKAGGNVSKAAQLLGINRTKIYRILAHSDGQE